MTECEAGENEWKYKDVVDVSYSDDRDEMQKTVDKG